LERKTVRYSKALVEENARGFVAEIVVACAVRMMGELAASMSRIEEGCLRDVLKTLHLESPQTKRKKRK
jgi:hypothetical protein